MRIFEFIIIGINVIQNLSSIDPWDLYVQVVAVFEIRNTLEISWITMANKFICVNSHNVINGDNRFCITKFDVWKERSTLAHLHKYAK